MFVVHQQILAKSPVLACVTKSSFSEGMTKEITLPEDDADQIGRLISYLYGNHEDALDFGGPHEDSIKVDKLADMYALAEKYQLSSMQVDIIEALKNVPWLSENRAAFFETAQRICQSTRDSDEVFGGYFAEQAAKHLRTYPGQEKIGKLSELIELGGSFARMVLEVLIKVYGEDKLEWSNKKNSMKNEQRHLKLIHGIHHPRCTYCTSR